MRVLYYTLLTLAAPVTAVVVDEPLPPITEELRAAGLAKLKAAMEAYPMTGGVFIDASQVPPRVLLVPGQEAPPPFEPKR